MYMYYYKYVFCEKLILLLYQHSLGLTLLFFTNLIVTNIQLFKLYTQSFVLFVIYSSMILVINLCLIGCIYSPDLLPFTLHLLFMAC